MTNCPVGCLYCMATQIESRSKFWGKGARIGLNKSCAFINRLPSDPPLSECNIPWELFHGEYLGFQGITDCFWSIYKDDLKWLVKKVKEIGVQKLVLTSKIPISAEQLSIVEPIKDRLVIIYSVTGLDMLEKIKTKDRLDAICRCKEKGIDVLPLIHPYIHVYSDVSFFPFFQDIGIQFISWKGFRYNEKTMCELSKIIPNEVLSLYRNKGEEETLIGEDFLQGLANKHNMQYIPLREYIQKEECVQGISFEQAEREVKELSSLVVFSSSEKNKEEIINHAIQRRVNKC